MVAATDDPEAIEIMSSSTDTVSPVKKPGRRKKNNAGAVVATILAIAAVGGGYAYSRSRSAATSEATALQYKTAKVERGDIKKTVSATGTLKPWRTVDIKSRAGGEVKVLAVEVGNTVTNGQLIARIDPTDSMTTFRQADADLDSAVARKSQSQESYQLQTRQTDIAIRNAEADLASVKASRAQVEARLRTATTQSATQPALTAAAIAQSKASYDQAVKQRKQLDATNPQQKASAKAAYDQAIANRDNALANSKRQESLVAKGFVSQSAVDQARATLAVNEAQVGSAKARLDTIADELSANVDNADARVAQAKAALDAARQNAVAIPNQRNSLAESRAALLQAEASVKRSEASLAQAKANATNNKIRQFDVVTAQATIARTEASRSNAETVLKQTEVRAPTGGVVLQKYVEQGAIITSGLSLNSTGTNIIQIGDTDRMYVDVTVDETDIANVDEGQKVEVSFESYPGVPFEGKVARIDPQAVVEQNVTSVHVRVEVDNSSPTFRLLKPGMNSTCEFVLEEKENVVSVPTEAVREDDKGKYVETSAGGKPSKDDPTTFFGVKKTRVGVETGMEGNDGVEIVSGLKGGEMIITQTIEPAPPTAPGGAVGGGSPFGGGRGFGGGGGGRGGR